MISQHGLLDNEIVDILSLNDVVLDEVFEWWTPPLRRLPIFLWTRVQSELGPYLVYNHLWTSMLLNQ